jgi:hypothetical protein
MTRKGQLLIILVVALVNVTTEVSGQGLEANLARARLPDARVESSAVYDGVDSVYLFGG